METSRTSTSFCPDSLAHSVLEQLGRRRRLPKYAEILEDIAYCGLGCGLRPSCVSRAKRTFPHPLPIRLGCYNNACIQSLCAHCLAVLPRPSLSCGSAPALSSSSMISLWQLFDSGEPVPPLPVFCTARCNGVDP